MHAAPAAGQPARTRRTEISEHVLEQGATLVPVLQRRHRRQRRRVPDEALDRLADVARVGAAGARARWRPTPSAGLASAVAEGVRRPQGWPDDVAVLVAHRRETALEPLQLDLVATPAALPGRAPAARRLAGRARAWASRTASA